jgi:hypothetical protein
MGLAVFAVSTFTPTQQFGSLMITILAIALVGDLVMLPALLCGPLGWFFAPKAPATPEDALRHPVPATAPKPVKPEFVADASAAAPKPVATPQAAPESASKASAPEAKGDSLTPANAALRSKLQKFRRSPERDAAS